MRSTKALLPGAACLFDPRCVLRDRSAAVVRRIVQVGARKPRFAGGHARGAVALAHRPTTVPDVVVDERVVQRIRSEALREAGVSAKDVEVQVENGVATTHGSVDGCSRADQLVGRVAKVSSVQDVAAIIPVLNSETTP